MELKSDTEISKPCENCGRELYGRTDKRFCNDNCRNEFNRRKKQEELAKTNESMPEILKVIRRNYEILLSYGEIESGTEIFVKKIALEEKGFNFKFYTSVDFNNEQYRFCFERGWKEVDGTVYIRDDLGQAAIE
jgi:hypothetical protein